MTMRSRLRPGCRRTWKVAEELASSLSFFSVTVPAAVRRWTRTNLPWNERAPETVVEKLRLARLTSSSEISGRTLTVTGWLVNCFHLASYLVWIDGLTVLLHLPPLTVSMVSPALKLDWPNASARTVTFSPALWLETAPESFTVPP